MSGSPTTIYDGKVEDRLLRQSAVKQGIAEVAVCSGLVFGTSGSLLGMGLKSRAGCSGAVSIISGINRQEWNEYCMMKSEARQA